MNIKSISLALIVTSLAWGCFDEPRKVKLKGTSLDSLSMRASSEGLSVNLKYRFYYDLKKKSWCIETFASESSQCNLLRHDLIDDQGSIVGLVTFDDAKRELSIHPIVPRIGNIEYSVPHLNLKNESDPASIQYGFERYNLKAINSDGSILGEVKAAHQRGSRGTKGGLGTEEKPEVDLTQKVKVSSGCGGSGDSNAGTPHKPEVTFEVDDKEQHQ